MRRILLGVILIAACNDPKDPYEVPQLIDPTPFSMPRDERIRTHTNLDGVDIDRPVTLRWSPGGATMVTWTLEVPPGSTAALDDPAAAEPSFTPDIEGAYLVRVIADGEEAQRRITAASYRGASHCRSCHLVRGDAWSATPHATTVADVGSILFGNGRSCLTCHIVNPVDNPAPPVIGSFDDVAAQEGLDPDTYTFTNFASYSADFPQTAARSAVACEMCHGPGSQHVSDPRRIGRSLDAENCGKCHNGVVGPDRFGQWTTSLHGSTTRRTSSANCQRCHTAEGFLAWVRGDQAEAQNSSTAGITCAVCHTAHGDGLPAQLRVFGTVPILSGRPYNGGRGAACLYCHQSEVEDPAAHADANSRFPFSVHADMLTGQGAVEYGLSFADSFHGTTVFRLRPFTGDPDDSETPDSCVICHVASGPTDALGGHAMAMRDGTTEFAVDNCDRCHPGLDTFDWNRGKDWDGDGRREGTQTEVKGLTEVLYVAIRGADLNQAVTRPGGALTLAFVDDDLSLSTTALRQAVYNYNFSVDDRSWGIHNTAYAVQLLQRTYEQVTGRAFKDDFPNADIR
ncbi:MAG: hypothetical protein ACYTGN_15920 [Planctomycetota bacterium]|jgi:hypothetical protein